MKSTKCCPLNWMKRCVLKDSVWYLTDQEAGREHGRLIAAETEAMNVGRFAIAVGVASLLYQASNQNNKLVTPVLCREARPTDRVRFVQREDGAEHRGLNLFGRFFQFESETEAILSPEYGGRCLSAKAANIFRLLFLPPYNQFSAGQYRQVFRWI